MRKSNLLLTLILFSQIVAGCISGSDDDATKKKVGELESRLNNLEQKLDSIKNSSTCPQHGWVYEKDESGSTIGTPISGARVIFTSEDSTFSDTVFSSQNGRYNVRLPFDRYFARADAPGYHPYDSYPGFHVCWTDTLSVGNFFVSKE
jgi:outer membrane murein-binding lipoprotein Lpp